MKYYQLVAPLHVGINSIDRTVATGCLWSRVGDRSLIPACVQCLKAIREEMARDAYNFLGVRGWDVHFVEVFDDGVAE